VCYDEIVKVLIVDDDVDVCQGLAIGLSYQGYEVGYATDVRSAFSALATGPPDVLICDWQLQDAALDGVDVARSFREKHPVKIVMVTALKLEDLKRRAGDLPVSDYLRKPVALRDLLHAIAI